MFGKDSRRFPGVPSSRLRALVLVPVIGASLAVVSATFAGDGGQAWSMIGRDPANSRNQPFEHHIGPSTVATLAPKWVATTTGDVSGTPAVADGAVYFGDFGGTLWKLDASTGATIWSHQVADYTGHRRRPTRARARRSTATRSSSADARRLRTCSVSTQRPARCSGRRRCTPTRTAVMTGSPVLVGDTIITGVSATGASAPATATFRGAIVALDALTGAILWRTYSLPDNGGASGRLCGRHDVLAARGRRLGRARLRHIRTALPEAGERDRVPRGCTGRLQRIVRAAGVLPRIHRRVRPEDGRAAVVVPRRSATIAVGAGVRQRSRPRCTWCAPAEVRRDEKWDLGGIRASNVIPKHRSTA